MLCNMPLIGPTLENRAKNSIAKADAMIRFGRYITVWKNALPLSFRLGLANHDARRSDIRICGMNPMIHMIIVFPKYFQMSLPENIVL